MIATAQQLLGAHEYDDRFRQSLEITITTFKRSIELSKKLAEENKLRPGSLLLDFPQKPALLAADLPVQLRDGTSAPLNRGSGPWPLGIKQVGEQLHTTARHLRVFAAEPAKIDPNKVLELAEMTAEEVERHLDQAS